MNSLPKPSLCCSLATESRLDSGRHKASHSSNVCSRYGVVRLLRTEEALEGITFCHKTMPRAPFFLHSRCDSITKALLFVFPCPFLPVPSKCPTVKSSNL